jgi:ABC-type Zn uptake system ZnuABC Zn-binding protein ZnuA
MLARNVSWRRWAAALAVAVAGPAQAQDRLTVVTTLPTFASIAREVTGDAADVSAIARGDEDPHFVTPRPSFAATLRRADLFVTTGLDLELWVPTLLDRAHNRRIVEGAPGHVVAYAGVRLLDIPANVSRVGGDVHAYGNPHIHTDPVNAVIVARNILAGLERIDRGRAELYRENTVRFEDRVMRRLFGDQLVDMLGADALFDLARGGTFWQFAASNAFGGRPLTEYVGGWLAAARPFRGRAVVCYHKNWAYFSARFDVPCAMFVEPKPGIPPSPGHVRDVIDFIRTNRIPALLAANYFAASRVRRVADRAETAAVVVPEHVEGAEGVDDYFTLVDTWIDGLAAAFADGRSR